MVRMMMMILLIIISLIMIIVVINITIRRRNRSVRLLTNPSQEVTPACFHKNVILNT